VELDSNKSAMFHSTTAKITISNETGYT
jgi:hypothetical protein